MTDKVIENTDNEDKTMSAEQQINSLNDLKEKKLIADEEYKEKKNKIIDEL